MSDKARRVLGMIFGFSMGLLYGLVSQYINVWVLPQIPLFQPEPGRFASLILLALFGGLMGLVIAWPLDAIPGVVLGAFLATVTQTAISVHSQASIPGNVVGLTYILLITFLPRVVLVLPIAGLIRWFLDVWDREIVRVTFSIRKLSLSLVALVLISILAGLLSLYPSDGRDALSKTNALVQAGILAEADDRLPTVLKTVDGFLQKASGGYSLQLSDNPDALPIPRPFASYQANEYAVIVRFENGYHFACVFVTPHPEPNCGEY
jgi:hypothetical protein